MAKGCTSTRRTAGSDSCPKECQAPIGWWRIWLVCRRRRGRAHSRRDSCDRTEVRPRSNDFRDVLIGLIPGFQKMFVFRRGQLSLTFSFVCDSKMIVRQRVVRIDAEHARVLGNRLIKRTQRGMRIRQAVFQCVHIPIRRSVLESFFEVLYCLRRSPALQLKITATVVIPPLGFSGASIWCGRAYKELFFKFVELCLLTPLQRN